MIRVKVMKCFFFTVVMPHKIFSFFLHLDLLLLFSSNADQTQESHQDHDGQEGNQPDQPDLLYHEVKSRSPLVTSVSCGGNGVVVVFAVVVIEDLEVRGGDCEQGRLRKWTNA